MTETDIAAVERACTQLSIAYARAIDFRDYDAFVLLFTEDGVLDVGTTLHGRDAIREWLRHRPDELRSRHVISNVFVDVLGPDEARGISYLTLYRHHGEESVRFGPVPLTGPAAVGHYEDRFVRTEEGWLFRSRRAHIAFRNPDLCDG
ncbi:MAG TPA: nuclear transport factor 2 family protein [Pseudomonadales bacterium]|jgi:3-phenylpropionate/cinnamic acid dioxygenase small subunit